MSKRNRRRIKGGGVLLILLFGLFLVVFISKNPTVSGAATLRGESIYGPCTDEGAYDIVEEIIARDFKCGIDCEDIARSGRLPGSIEIIIECSSNEEANQFMNSCLNYFKEFCEK